MTNTSNRWSALALSKTLLFRTLTYRAAGFLAKPLLLLDLAHKALIKAEKDSSLAGIAQGALDSVYLLVRMIKAYVSGTYRGLSTQNIVLVIAAILYFISPIDIVPDIIPVVGLLDDITLMGWVIQTVGAELGRFEEYETTSHQGLLARSYQDLYEEAKQRGISGRSGMSKLELVEALSA